MSLLASGCDSPDYGHGPVLGPAPIGFGFCCPVDQQPSCACFRNGGWLPTDSPELCRPAVCDLGPPYESHADDHGCTSWSAIDNFCNDQPDAGLADADAAVDAAP